MRRLVLLPLVLLALAAACGTDDGADVRASASASGSGSGSGNGSGSEADEAACVEVGDAELGRQQVAVELDEFSVDPEVDEIPSGAVTFVLDNVGEEPHEFVVVRGAADDLPVDEGAVDESGLPAGAFVGEVEPFAPGTCQGTFALTPGDFTLLCNIPGHFEEGMYASFTVT